MCAFDMQPRPEHPRPQFFRKSWLNLNGQWTCKFDPGKSGMQRSYFNAKEFDQPILIPFCPEAQLSGIGNTDFIDAIWYHKKFSVPEEWSKKKILLHFGAVDYESEVYINGILAGTHWGGSSSFHFDITKFLTPGPNHLVVHAQDNIRSGNQTGGKQSLEYSSIGCFYTRTTGIWQTVWLEAVNAYSLENCVILPDLDGQSFHLKPRFKQHKSNLVFSAKLFDNDSLCGEVSRSLGNSSVCSFRIDNANPWSPENPFLYKLLFEVKTADGEVLDSVESYAGLRKIHVDGNNLFLNNEPLYLRFVLDQGYYEKGLWTAPTDTDLRNDIELAKTAGFNGARLHQKVFEQRFHYWADMLGYLTWGESPSWGLDCKSEIAARNFLSEWREVVLRDINHPSIIAWTTLNETWDISNKRQHNRLHMEAYELTRALDPTRPVNNASGGCHVKTDLYTVHIYEQDPLQLSFDLTPDEDGNVFQTLGEKEVKYDGEPYIIDEFGGIKWTPDLNRLTHGSWGYGESPITLEEFYERLEGQIQAILGLSHASGYCYTQLTDVEQEQNGLFFYDRSHKFDIKKIFRIFTLMPKEFKK
jgi:beta-galactosidase/beta-glucuronidase